MAFNVRQMPADRAAVPNGVALGVPDDIAEAARCSAAASARDGRAEGEKRKAGM